MPKEQVELRNSWADSETCKTLTLPRQVFTNGNDNDSALKYTILPGATEYTYNVHVRIG